MDEVEEAGLRAFTITVGVEIDANRRVNPLWLARGSSEIEVVAIESSWREEERIGFRARLADGSSWLLYYVPELNLWSGIADGGHVGNGPP
jgi:hypothetical protein